MKVRERRRKGGGRGEKEEEEREKGTNIMLFRLYGLEFVVVRLESADERVEDEMRSGQLLFLHSAIVRNLTSPLISFNLNNQMNTGQRRN